MMPCNSKCSRFQLTAARRRLVLTTHRASRHIAFQLTAARRRLGRLSLPTTGKTMFQLTAARRRLGRPSLRAAAGTLVSTHSRPKAAGKHECADCPKRGRFNSQPLEGGWFLNCQMPSKTFPFQLTAARRRLVGEDSEGKTTVKVSTHSRPKAAGTSRVVAMILDNVSTHSRPKAAGQFCAVALCLVNVSTHSRPKAAGICTW